MCHSMDSCQNIQTCQGIFTKWQVNSSTEHFHYDIFKHNSQKKNNQKAFRVKTSTKVVASLGEGIILHGKYTAG